MIMNKEISGRVKKVLSQNIWYHGTVFSNWKNFCDNGIIVNHNKDASDSLDFGYGFYLTPSSERAEDYIFRMLDNTGFYLSRRRLPLL